MPRTPSGAVWRDRAHGCKSAFMTVSQEDARCPVCGGAGIHECDLHGSDARGMLGDVFGAPPPETVLLCDYSMHACADCGLVFAAPMRAGDGAFYDWVTGFDRYVATHRWEWRAIRSILAREAGPVRLLEIGCGAGAFLHSIADLKHVRATGIDRSEGSVAAARAQGVDARVATVEALLAERSGGQGFDAVVATHVLEHLEDPLGFVKRCAGLLNPGGSLLFSTPYSPLSRELLGWDVMNMPPHHLTRWNGRAFRKLAEVAGLDIAIHAPRAKPALKRAIRQTCIRVTGEDRKFPPGERLRILLRHIGVFREVLAWARSRDRLDGRPAPDKVLVRLSLPSA